MQNSKKVKHITLLLEILVILAFFELGKKVPENVKLSLDV